MFLQKSFSRPAYAAESIIIGDSITYQYKINYQDRFTGTWQIDSYGIPGATFSQVAGNLPNLDAYKNIFILLGINNLNSGDTAEEVRDDALLFLDAVKYRNTYIISILPLDNVQKPTPLNSLIQETNALLLQLGNFINCYDSLAIGPGGNNPYTYDGTHLIQEGYDIIEPIIYANILDL